MNRPAKIIGVLTRDVRLYYDLMKFLKSRKLEFRMLDFEKGIPRDIGAILTSPEEFDLIAFEPKFSVKEIETDVRKARQAMNGLDDSHILIIGIDPGPMPGIAAMFNDNIIETRQAQNPAHAADIIFGILSDYSYAQAVLRIGNGSPEERDKIIELIAGNFDEIQIVDEASTSRVGEGHEDSAVRIAGDDRNISRLGCNQTRCTGVNNLNRE